MTAELTFTTTRSEAPLPDAEREAVLANPGFGSTFTDHMVTATWTKGEGWHTGEVRPFGPLQVSPAAAVLHYAQEVFEGMKAYRHADGSVWTFRPDRNAARMARSCERLALPVLPQEDFIGAITALVEIDEAWVPAADSGEMSLYLRPFMFASEAFLGVRPANEVTFSVIASPAGAYFAGGLKPVNLWLSRDYARAGAGGTGAAKCGGNYASSLAGQLEGQAQGCDQVVFLDSSTQTYIEELGGMNLFFVTRDGRLRTPALTGSILEGVTRDSILAIAPDLGLTPEEARIGIDEWTEGVASGEITEVFACGTAAVITPVGELRWAGGSAPSTAGEGGGEYTRKIRQALLDIQYGRAEDTRGWMTRLV
ncbi:branched-chain amino acid aminotransferase [Janibacter terrae]|uniref:Branched-chain-amino-acid aminotransferase n=1 Tax=Janibacter terrae TaxID=103817 RepID=A0ABZ2FDY0_9MICO